MDVSERVSALRAELQSYGEEIIAHIQVLHSTHELPSKPKVDLKSDPRNAVILLKHDLQEILQTVSVQSHTENEKSAAELDECSKLMDTLTLVTKTCELQMKCEEAVAGTDLTTACNLIGELESSIDHLPGVNSEVGSGYVCQTLRKEFQILKFRFQSRLKRMLLNAIQIEYGRMFVHKSLKGVLNGEDRVLDKPILLTDIWSALLEVDCVDDCIGRVVTSFWLCVLQPLWKEKKGTVPSIRTAEENSEFFFESISRDYAVQDNQNVDPTTTDESISRGKKPVQAIFVASCRMPVPLLFEQIGQSFSFFWSEVLCANEEVANKAAEFIHSAPISFINVLVDTLTSSMPKVESDLANFHKIVERPCKDLETRLKSFGFMGRKVQDDLKKGNSLLGQTDQDDPLSSIVADLSIRYAETKRREILGKAREHLLADYHNTMMATGNAVDDDPASAGDIGDLKAMLDSSGTCDLTSLRFECCQTSLAACRLLKLIHSVMQQACSASPKIANILYQSSRDCMELFMAIIPMKFADVIETVPRMGSVFYNDCLYIAHNCTIITHLYREKFCSTDDLTKQSTMGFIDFIPRLRLLGEKCLMLHVEEQKGLLSEYISRINLDPGGDGNCDTNAGGGSNPNLSSSSSSTNAGSAVSTPRGLLAAAIGGLGGNIARAVDSRRTPDTSRDPDSNNEEGAVLTVRHLERLSNQWKGVLQDTVYERLMGFLLEQVITTAMYPLLKAECITESAAADISRVMRTIQTARTIFPEAHDGVGSTSASAEAYLSKVVPSWKKFTALTDLLEYSLSEIAEWLPRRKFSAFTSKEMTDLIKALFEDSSKRQGILAAILDMSA